jgi:hypothetical protein
VLVVNSSKLCTFVQNSPFLQLPVVKNSGHSLSLFFSCIVTFICLFLDSSFIFIILTLNKMPVSRKAVDRIFMIWAGIIGFILFICSIKALNGLQRNCTVPLIYGGLVIILMISSIITTLSISYLFCTWKGGNCYFDNPTGTDTSELYLTITCALTFSMSILLISMGSRLKKYNVCYKSTGDKKTSYGSALEFYIWTMAVICVLITIAGSFGLYYTNYVIPRHVGDVNKLKPQSSFQNQGGFSQPGFLGFGVPRSQ